MSLDELTIADVDTSDVNYADTHIKCCLLDGFLCKAPYHPELVAADDSDEEDACLTCVDVRYECMCPPRRPTHGHCPLREYARCPRQS